MIKDYIFDEEGNLLDLRDKAVVIENMDYLSLADVPWFNDDEQIVECFVQMDKENILYASENLKEKFRKLFKLKKQDDKAYVACNQEEIEMI